jgi:hypothetical protein
MPRDQLPSRSEFRIVVVNNGNVQNPLHLPCADEADARRARESWSKDPDPNADVWIERREISPWERVP